MENITIGVVVSIIVGLAALIKAVLYLQEQAREATKSMLREEFEDVNDSIRELRTDMTSGFNEVNQKIDKSDMEACKNFLVHCLTDFDRGIGDDAMLQRFWNQYDYYRAHDGNSYIKSRVEYLKESGKLRELDK